VKQVPYLACTRCGLVVMQGSNHNGSPLCRDCWHDDEIVVKMDLILVPTPKPPTRQA
jgi:hypothetical protein